MLKDFRSMAKGWGAWVIVILFILAFGVVGMPQLSNYGGKPTLAVGDTRYSIRDVENEFTRLVERERLENQTILTREEAIAQGVLQEAITRLATEGLYREEAKHLGVTTTDDMVQSFLGSMEDLQNDRTGKIDSALLARIAQSNNMSLSQFKNRVSNDIMRNQIDSALALSLLMPEEASTLLALRQTEERTVRTAILDAEEVIEATEQELLSYFAANTDKYLIPEQRTYTFAVIDPVSIRDRIEVDEEDVLALFAARESSLGTPEKRNFIVAQFPDPQTAQSVAAAVREGATLADTASSSGASVTTFSDQSKDELIDSTVAEAVFNAPTTGLIGPIEGDFGYVVASISSITPAVTVTLEEVRAELEDELIGADVSRTQMELYDELQLAGDRGESLADAAASLSIEVRTIGPVARTFASVEAQLAANVPQSIHLMAFEMNEGAIFEEVDLPDRVSGFVEVLSITPEKAQEYETVAAQVQADFGETQKSSSIEATIASFRSRIDSGMSFEAAVNEMGGKTIAYTLNLLSDNPAVPPSIARELFETPVGDIAAGAGFEPATAIVAQTESVRFTPNAQLDRIADAYRNQLSQSLSEEIYSAYLEAAQNSLGTERNTSEINANFGIEP